MFVVNQLLGWLLLKGDTADGSKRHDDGSNRHLTVQNRHAMCGLVQSSFCVWRVDEQLGNTLSVHRSLKVESCGWVLGRAAQHTAQHAAQHAGQHKAQARGLPVEWVSLLATAGCCEQLVLGCELCTRH